MKASQQSLVTILEASRYSSNKVGKWIDLSGFVETGHFIVMITNTNKGTGRSMTMTLQQNNKKSVTGASVLRTFSVPDSSDGLNVMVSVDAAEIQRYVRVAAVLLGTSERFGISVAFVGTNTQGKQPDA